MELTFSSPDSCQRIGHGKEVHVVFPLLDGNTKTEDLESGFELTVWLCGRYVFLSLQNKFSAVMSEVQSTEQL